VVVGKAQKSFGGGRKPAEGTAFKTSMVGSSSKIRFAPRFGAAKTFEDLSKAAG
jgi:hypothetical protein